MYDNPLERVEVGASIFIPENEILWNAAREFSLPLTDASADEDGPLGIWDGERFVHIQGTGSTWWEYAKLFWKYGLAPYRTKKLVDQTVQTFLQLYRAPNFPFRSLTSRAFELGLVRATADTGSQFLSKNGVRPRLSTRFSPWRASHSLLTRSDRFPKNLLMISSRLARESTMLPIFSTSMAWIPW